MTGNNNAIAEALFNKLPYNILTDFASVSTASFFDLLIVTRAGSPLHIAATTSSRPPRPIPASSISAPSLPGSTQNLAAELFVSTAGIKATIVTFRTSPDMANAVHARRCRCRVRVLRGVHGLLAANKLVALASTGAKRTAYLPDVPTAIESGIKGYEVVSWNGLAVPA